MPALFDNVTVVRAGTVDEFLQKVGQHLQRPWQLTLIEPNIDGMMAAAILGTAPTGPHPCRCIDQPLTEKDWHKLAKRGTRRVVALHSHLLYESELDTIGRVFWCNPLESGLEDMCTSQIAYRAMALAAAGKKEKAETLLAKLEEEGKDDGGILHNVARGYALMGDADKMASTIKRAVVEHAGPTEKELNFDFHFKNYSLPFEDRTI